MENIKIFLHEKEKFIFYLEQDTMPDSFKIDHSTLHSEHATTFILRWTSHSYSSNKSISLSHAHMKSISRSDKECEEEDYNWGDCLDEMFYSKKGCQDPWNVNPRVPLRVCTNVTEIMLSYRQGPPELIQDLEWDGQFWDRPHMSERELADIIRNGMRCKTPCLMVHHDIKWRSPVHKTK